MRKLYKWNHSASRGGWHFIQNVLDCEIVGESKARLRDALENALRPHKLPDVAIKIFPSHFHVFLPPKPTIPIKIIGEMRSSVSGLGIVLDEEYYWGAVYDISQEHIDKILEETLGEKYECYNKGD